MANIEGKNFTDFRNLNLKGDAYQGGTPGGGLGGGVIRFTSGQTAGGLVGASGAWDSTLAIATFSGATSGAANGSSTNEVPYLSLANIGLNLGTGFIRYVTGSQAGTMSVGTATNDQDKAWVFPNKSGTFGITGTFNVDLPVVAASGYLSTLVTVSGIRTEDGVVVVPQNGGGVGVLSARGALVVAEALAGNGNITLLLVNAFATATIARTSQFAYTAVR